VLAHVPLWESEESSALLRLRGCPTEVCTHSCIAVGVLARRSLDGTAAGCLKEPAVAANDFLVRVARHLDERVADKDQGLIEATGIDDCERARRIDGSDLPSGKRSEPPSRA
jgi:hypothetical protein